MIFKDKRLKDFRNVLLLTWIALGLPTPTVRQYEMADVLQNVMKPTLGVPADPTFRDRYPHLWDEKRDAPVNRLVLQAFRGIGKSWITSAAVDWSLGLNPSMNEMVVSAAKQRADDFSTFTKRLIAEIDFFKPLAPRKDKGHRDSNVAFDVGPAPASHAPSVRSVGVLGQMTGGRGDIIIADDVEVPNNSETQVMREKLSARVKEFDAILKPGGVVIYLGTPQCEDSIYTELENRGYRRIIWPARYPGDGWMKHHGHALAPSIAQEMEDDPSLRSGGGLDGTMGKPTDSERFSEDDLREREASYGRSGFALQFMLDTSLSDAEKYPLKIADAIVMDLDPKLGPEKLVWARDPELEWKNIPNVAFRGDRFYRPLKVVGELIPYQGTIMAIDPSGMGADECAYAVCSFLNGYLFFHRVTGLRGGYSDENLVHMLEVAKEYGVSKIICEPNYGGGMFNELLKKHAKTVYPVTIEDSEWARGQKEIRIIDTLEPLLNQHRVVLSPKIIERDVIAHPGEAAEKGRIRQLIFQWTRLTRERQSLKHDDRLEAMAIAASYWTKSVAIDADQAKGDREREAFHQRMKELAARRGNPIRRRSLDDKRRERRVSKSFFGDLF